MDLFCKEDRFRIQHPTPQNFELFRQVDMKIYRNQIIAGYVAQGDGERPHPENLLNLRFGRFPISPEDPIVVMLCSIDKVEMVEKVLQYG